MIFAVFDWETTGLTKHRLAPIQDQPRAIEFGGLLTDGVEIFDTLEFICNPGMEIEPIITKITGLTNNDLYDKPRFTHFVPKLKSFFERADVAVSHNLSFDKAITQYDLERMNLTLEDIAWPKIEVCTVEQTMPQFGRRMKLIELYEHYIGKYEQKHRALDDVKLLHEICYEIGVYSMFEKGTP